MATQPGVMKLEEKGIDVESATKAVHEALEQALKALEQMRQTEGESIYADLDARLKLIEGWSREVNALAPRAVEEYRQRLSERVAELARGVAVDPQRLAQEVAMFAERTDIAEEIDAAGAATSSNSGPSWRAPSRRAAEWTSSSRRCTAR